MSKQEFWLIAGPNGAGKSTLAQSPEFSPLLLPKILNPDDVTWGFLRSAGYSGYADTPEEKLYEYSVRAANWVFARVKKALADGESIGVETVLSTDKYLPLFHQISDVGNANLIYVGNQNPDISIERIRIRVAKGKHDVPEEKVRARWERSLILLPDFWDIASQAFLFDHSDFLMLRAHKRTGNTVFYRENENDVLINALQRKFAF